MISIAGDEWECIEGRGHTMEHICLFSKAKNLLISGDQLLPKITSHVGVFPTEPNANPLDDWLESCKRLIDLVPEDVLVLPAHGRPFRRRWQPQTVLPLQATGRGARGR